MNKRQYKIYHHNQRSSRWDEDHHPTEAGLDYLARIPLVDSNVYKGNFHRGSLVDMRKPRYSPTASYVLRQGFSLVAIQVECRYRWDHTDPAKFKKKIPFPDRGI